MKTLEQIAAELQGYDPQSLSVDAVAAFVRELVQPIEETQKLGLFDSLDRVLAEDLICPLDVPPHDNSAMDGFALAGEQLQRAERELVLRIRGTALAGQAWRGSVAPGECVKIMTGAIMPAGCDTVVPQEMTQLSGDGQSVRIPCGLLRPGDNRRLRGEDLQRGQAALRRGERLGPARLGLAASLGVGMLRTYRPLRVAYFSTGSEILSLGQAPREGAVYDSNRYTVFGMLTGLGCQVLDLGVVSDDPPQLEAAFRQAAAQADVIISSGGVSVGEADFTKAMMKQLGDVAFWRVAMRPGRPMAVGRIRDEASGRHALLFGLPGNPVAVMVTFLAFVRPALLQMMGCTDAAPPLLRARSSQAIKKKPGRTEYQRGWVGCGRDGVPEVSLTGNQGSGILSSMAQANGLIVLHHGQGSVMPGDMVDVMMFEGTI
jgi:molybdopterin molybdotransferase